jgi:signal transduction histidine kinase/cell division septation protein DedD
MRSGKGKVQSIRLIIILAVTVILPGIILSVLALRAIEREEAFIEKNFNRTLSLEVINTATLLGAQLKAVQDELANIITVPKPVDAAAELKRMRGLSPLVGLPFLVSSKRAVIYPPNLEPLSAEDALLVNQNKELFEDNVSIPVYKNIVKEYKDTILNEEQDKNAPESNAPVTQAAGAQNQPADQSANQSAAGQNTNQQRQESAKALEEEIETQEAITRFDKSEPLRQKIYQRAREEGQQIMVRNIILPEDNRDSLNAQWSYFILESHTWSQIMNRAGGGIIPRFIEDKLYLLYWKKGADEAVVGCIIDTAALKKRLLEVMPAAYTETRILVILDEQARPLLVPTGEEQRQWYKPFAAREISELLPRWEIAAYLTDPGIIRTRARSTALVLWILIGFLLISLFLGGLLIAVLLVNQVRLAQQKTGFVANVSHELKTPLTSIRLFAELLRDNRQPDRAKRGMYLDIMISETERLTRLINNVLDFTRMAKGKKSYNPRETDLVGLCREILNTQTSRLEHLGFTVALDAPDDRVSVKIDEEALKQVIINLLSNAEKYSTRRKSIELKIRGDADTAKIDVLDRGPGIPLHLKEKIFKEFYRVDDSLTETVAGSGLGLPISRRILRDHGGDIQYSPRSGGGSRFRITIPRGEARDAKTKNTDR